MSGTGQMFKLTAQGQNISGSLNLMGVHINLPAVIDLIEKAFHDDNHDKLVERAEMLVVLAKRHQEEHRKLEEGQ